MSAWEKKAFFPELRHIFWHQKKSHDVRRLFLYFVMDILNFTYNTWILLGLFAVSLAAFKLSKIKFREVRFMMIFMLVFLVLNNLFIFLFDPNQGTTLYGTRHVLCHLF